MPNNLEALQTLKQSATEQKNELESMVKEIHKESLRELNKILKSTFSTSMENLETAIQNRLEKSVQNSIKTKNWIIITLTALVSMSVAIPTTWYLKPAEKVQAQENIIHAQPQTLYKEVENPKVIQENRNLHAQNETLENKIKQLQAENKKLKEWSIPDYNQGTTPNGKKWMLTSEVTRAENGKNWALVEK